MRSAVGVWFIWLFACGTGGASAELSPPGKWLVDLGRDYPLTPQAGASDADAEIALLFMQAATRIEPDQAEAYRWQIDLLYALQRQDQVRPTLEQYLRCVPEDLPARLAWVQVSLADLQTADARAAWCRQELAQGGLPPVVAADLHARLADYHWNRGEDADARREAEAALRQDSLNLQARQLLTDLAPPQEKLVHRVGMLLARLVINPGEAETARQLADELMWQALPAEAEVWYQHAMELSEAASPGYPPTDLLLARAAALMELGQLDAAETLARQAVAAEPAVVDTLLVRALSARLKGDARAADGHIRQAARLCNATVENAKKTQQMVDLDVAAEIAWFFGHYFPVPEDAENLARLVLEAQGNHLVGYRAMGTAQLLRKRYAQAQQILSVTADEDVWSAIKLARTLKEAGRSDEATARLRAAATRPSNFEQRHEIRELCREWSIDPPTTQPAALALKALVGSFRPQIREFPFHPGRNLSLSLSIAQLRFPPGEPWLCTVRLHNTGPFLITIGPGMMVEPWLLVLVQTKGDRPRSSGGSIRVMLDRQLRLAPGETLEVPQTLDIGVIRAGMIGTPQMGHEVQATAVLNPRAAIDADGQTNWEPGLGGLRSAPVAFEREALRVEGDLLKRLMNQTRSAFPRERIAAMDLMAMLLAERQHLAAGRLRYAARPVDPAALAPAVLALADDSDWYVRARLAECLRWIVLDPSTMPAAMKLLNDSHWLVRGLARRLLADQHGHKFDHVLQATAQTDADDWARAFSRALLARQQRAASANVAAPAVSRPVP